MNKDTKTELLESVSALADGAVAETELDQLLGHEHEGQEELVNAYWKQIHAVGSALRKEPQTGSDIFAAVSDAVANDKLDDDLLESLSAVADGEASEMELRRVLKQDSAGVDRYWGNYQSIGHALNREAQAGIDISAAVSEAIASESIATESAPSAKKAFLKPLSQFAVAASVAGLALIGVNQYQIAQQDLTGGDNSVAESEVTDPQIDTEYTPPAGFELQPQTSVVSGNSELRNVTEEIRPQIQFDQRAVQEHLKDSVEQHSENTSELSQDFYPLLRVPVEE